MKVTQAQAVKLWCPLARIMVSKETAAGVPLVATAVNQIAQNGEDKFLGTCIGAHCMLWQWADAEYEYNNIGGEGWERCGESTVLAKFRRPLPDRTGFCGLGRSG